MKERRKHARTFLDNCLTAEKYQIEVLEERLKIVFEKQLKKVNQVIDKFCEKC